jgi:fructose-specific PTS system IIA-like component
VEKQSSVPRLEYRFTLPLPNGLHARPASQLATVASRFTARITLRNERSGDGADAASVLELVSAGIQHGDPCLLTVSGNGAEAAFRTLQAYIDDVLPGTDAPLPRIESKSAARLPRSLADKRDSCFTGMSASPGIGIGRVVLLGPGQFASFEANLPAAPKRPLDEERARLSTALAAVEAELAQAVQTTRSEVMQALLTILHDKALHGSLISAVEDTGSAVHAVIQTVANYADKLRASPSEYLRERVVDLEDIGAQLLGQLNVDTDQLVLILTAPSIVVAPTLAARQFFGLDRAMLQGLVLTEAGVTSHAVILARSFGIPVVAGLSAGAGGRLPAGFEGTAVVDAGRGLFWPDADEPVQRFYAAEQATAARRRDWLARAGAEPARLRDGRRVEVGANVASAAEVAAAVALGAEGVGLFRTELLFAARESAPTEDEQYAEYRAAVEALGGRPLTVRTLDIGGDKPLPYLPLPREDNPFLGWRGVRLYAAHPGLIAAQLRAIVRASACGPVKVMAPMVSTAGEAREFRALVEAVKAALAAEGVAFNPNLPVGVMIETPAAALSIEALCGYCDFFSLGTNDLGQYFMAADRGNAQVAALNDPREPAFLRLLQQCVDAARRGGRWIGLCGELAGRLDLLPLVAGLGLDELSLAAPGIPAVKRALAQRSSSKCRALLAAAAAADTPADVQALLDLPAGAPALPLVAEELVELGCAARGKGEVLRACAGLAYAAGRTDDLDALEDALWAREETYSTGLGHGFAIPHCKSDAVAAPTLAVLRLAAPVDWGSTDDAAVDTAVMLALPASAGAQAHLRIFAQLARRLMHAEFRDALRTAADARTVVAYLTAQLDLARTGED